ncbi:carboxymuconolactone decarboxylase family protein [Rhizobium sp. BG4]|uniref:(R)-mandelonitrile lyase n=1 Tax=Rhizobium sp. BG4 TaxID=2613770 RepID=UPI00193DE4BD|nr:carboxymuconolactone decarboxylase family protein [Rhizobium sp. BG4]QRM44655.1 cupin domain-containing protein [Rhizobium sp. BG4]
MKKVAASIAMTTLAATGSEGAEHFKRVAPQAVYETAPGLGQFTDEVLFGEVWDRAELSPRDRSLVTIAVLVSTGKIAQTASHVGRALDNGVSPEEVGELITQLAFYSGWPNAMSAVNEAKKVFDERGVGPLSSSNGDRIELEAATEASRKAIVDSNVAPTAAALAELTNRVLFGGLWQRPDLAPRDRSMVTIAALVALGQPEQLPFHANRAMDNGLSRSEAAEVITQVAFYAGWPRAMSAVPVLKKVLEGRVAAVTGPTAFAEINVVRAGEGRADAPEQYFTGNVETSGFFRGGEPARVGGATVSFAPGARTAWHTHPLGQTLFIISGSGLVQMEGGPKQQVSAGDVVWIPAHVRHWHGASRNEAMSHFAVAEALDGSSVTWLEKVSDRDYASVAVVD